MSWCGYRQRQNITNSFMETGIGTSTIDEGLMLILQEILNVTQFMVHGKELILCDTGTLLDANIIDQIKVPGRGMAYQITAISGFL